MWTFGMIVIFKISIFKNFFVFDFMQSSKLIGLQLINIFTNYRVHSIYKILMRRNSNACREHRQESNKYK